VSDGGYVVEMIGITKVYPDGVKALDGVDFNLRRGEVHALLGENGAGKTTLMRILYGEIKPTSGKVVVDGREVRWRGPWDAIRAGIAMVYQQFRLIDSLTVEENLLIYLSSLGLSRSEARRRVEEAVGALGLEIPLEARVEDLPMGLRQRVEIVKAVSGGARVLILDEPTSNLTPKEAEALFSTIAALKSRGVSTVYITHRLGEVVKVADRVTVLRRGRVVASIERGHPDFSEDRLAYLMVGRIPRVEPAPSRPRGGDALRVEGLVVRDERGLVRVRGVSFSVRPGEIVGVAGVAGNGQDEMVEAIIGLRRPERGRVIVNGVEVRGPSDFYRAGGAYIPGDRLKALAPELAVGENAAFIYYTGSKKISLPPSEVETIYRGLVEKFALKAPGAWAPLASLSGGNQQKVLVGSEMMRGFRVLVAVNPTQGLDVATAAFVRGMIARAASQGAAVLLVSSDLDEVVELSHRILVMTSGRIAGEVPRGEATPERIGVLMGGGA
jgi:simple sugar transport system ATP-binding protein